MAYSGAVIFVETPSFTRRWDDYFDDDQYSLLQAALMACPDAGDVIRGSGGLRKVRWAVEAKGKRGGLRIIYYWMKSRTHIYFLTVYRKSEVTDPSSADVKVLREMVKQIDGE
jgi:mRNA-degrading endonuclease RelE of RelBE toxin-antitoxin system